MGVPTMLYKYPGKTQLHEDFFDYITVDSQDVKAAIAAGWSLTTPEAKAKGSEPTPSKRAKSEAKTADLDI